MEILHTFIQFVLHIDVHIAEMVVLFGPWVYILLFAIVFCETGLVVTPFLPGDSLVFAVGALAARGSLNIYVIIPLLIVAALCGDNVNYCAGRFFGARLFKNDRSRFFKRKYLEKAHVFYEHHGAKAIVIARFVPIIRTFCPFVAGFGTMRYSLFLSLSAIAAVLWIGLIGMLSFFFGNIAFVKANFGYVVVAIIVLSLLPPLVEWWRFSVKNFLREKIKK